MAKNRCSICHQLFTPAKRHPQQKVCVDPVCRKKRKSTWQKHKMKTDPDYQANQKQACLSWRESNPDYNRCYRKLNPRHIERNRLLQKIRNHRKTHQKPSRLKPDINAFIAKMDLVKSAKGKRQIAFWLIPMIAKMDPVKVFPVYISDG